WRPWRRAARTHRGARPPAGPENPVRAHHPHRSLVPRTRLPTQRRRASAGGTSVAVQLPASVEGVREEAVKSSWKPKAGSWKLEAGSKSEKRDSGVAAIPSGGGRRAEFIRPMWAMAEQVRPYALPQMPMDSRL